MFSKIEYKAQDSLLFTFFLSLRQGLSQKLMLVLNRNFPASATRVLEL